jgi:hypothetical protein
MRVLTPLEPLSHLSVILDLADDEVPGDEPSIVERAGAFVAVSVTQHWSCARPFWWWRHSPSRLTGISSLWAALCAPIGGAPLKRLGRRAQEPLAAACAVLLSFCTIDYPGDAVECARLPTTRCGLRRTAGGLGPRG